MKKHKTFRVEITYRAHQSDGEKFDVREERRIWKRAIEDYLEGPQFTHRRLKVKEIPTAAAKGE